MTRTYEPHLRELSDGDYTTRWCASCDRHFRACRCEAPDFRLRRNGQLLPLPEPLVVVEDDPYLMTPLSTMLSKPAG